MVFAWQRRAGCIDPRPARGVAECKIDPGALRVRRRSAVACAAPAPDRPPGVPAKKCACPAYIPRSCDFGCVVNRPQYPAHIRQKRKTPVLIPDLLSVAVRRWICVKSGSSRTGILSDLPTTFYNCYNF